MKKWKCDRCNGYILIDFDSIKVNDKVDFKIFEDTSGIYSKYATGRVIFRDGDIIYVACEFGFHVLNKYKVYPSGAPIGFIYNMFWVCFCDN
ncbi:hypothetical protein [Acinetobacter sp. CE-15]|uniref:hypothetical protein n=1 Tax=Acinetobacter sp. CE-15 TaxID=3425693 RepID=UPI003DA37A61